MDELKEMQTQLNALKESLNNVEIANARLLKKVVSQKIKSINRIVIWECILLPISFLLITSFCVAMNINLWLVWSAAIAAVIDLILDFKTLRISPKEIASDSFMQIKNKIQKQKKQRKIQNAVMLPLTIIWLTAFFIEAFHPSAFSGEDKAIVMTLIIITLLITILIILYVIHRVEKAADSVISEIDFRNEAGN